MESAEYSAHGDAISLATLAPIPSFAPFSLLPDELILAIVRHLPQLQNYPSGRERSWSKEQRSMESFASVDKRIRRIALSVRWEVRSYLALRPLPLDEGTDLAGPAPLSKRRPSC